MGPLVITWQNVVNIAPELAKVPEPAQTEILNFVEAQVPIERWQSRQAIGQTYLAAHLGTLRRRRGEGPVASQNDGGLSESDHSLLAADGMLGQSSYGIEYLRLIRLLSRVAFGMVA